MQVDPKVGAWVNVLVLILTGLVGGSVIIPGLNTAFAEALRNWSGVALFVLTSMNTVFHLYSAPTAGPLVKGNGS